MTENIKNKCICCKCKICNKRGPVGDRGNKGPSGDKGPKGNKGFKGAMGDDGDKGDRGNKGETGDKGLKGAKGIKGPKGILGDKGDKGDIGDIGDRGPSGMVGEKGPKGLRGDMGEIGEVGDKGPIGVTGPQGDRGDKGPIGIKGFFGDKGPIGIKGPQGEAGDKGPRGEKGPLGLQGINGEKGFTGPQGFFGVPGQCIASPSEVILAKTAQYIANEGLKCYIEINNPNPISIKGIGGVANAEGITSSNLSYFEMKSGNIMGIKNIESINIVVNQNDRDTVDKIIDDMREIFDAFDDCAKASPETVPINDNGEFVSTGNIMYDYEYTPICKCTSDASNKCICKGEKVDVCMYRGSKINSLRKIIEIEKEKGKKIRTVVTSKSNFTDLTMLNSPIIIEIVALGVVVLNYNINQGLGYSITSIIALDKINAIEFRN